MDWIKWNLLVLLVTTGKHTDAVNNTSSPTSTTAQPTKITGWEEPAKEGAKNSLVSSATISSTSPTTTLSPSLTNISSTSATTTKGTSKEPSTTTSTTTTSPTTSPIVCSPPEIAHGTVNTDSSSYVPGTSILFTCHAGYELSDAHTLTCSEAGQWNGSSPECTQIVCTPPNIAHGEFHLNKAPFLPGTSVSFTCNAGYKLNDDAHYLTCSEAGKWNGSAPECTQIVCTPPQIGNGEVAKDNSSYVPGTSISFKCNDGYKLSDIYTLTCSEAGQWNGSAPECTQIVCQPVEQIGNGTITSTPPYLPGQNITFNCSVGFRPPGGKERYSCTSSGNWTGDYPECKMISCSRPSAIDNGDYSPKQEYYKYNTSVTYNCKPGFKPDDDMTIICLLSGNWSAKRPTCSLKRISYNKTCVYSETEKPCITKNATCMQTEGDEFRCLCTPDKFYLNSNGTRDSCLSKIVYNMTILNLRIRDDLTTERSAVLEWDDNQNVPAFTNLMIVIKDENGTEVQREAAYRSFDPKMKRKELTKLNPGHHYTAVITVHDDKGVPSLTNTTLEFCTRPLPVRTITFENVDLRSFSVNWDYDISSSFTEISISVASVVQMAPDIFVDCPNQQPDKHLCIMDRNDSVTQLRMHNLTPGTAYTISIYTGICNPKLRSQPSISSTYTVPSVPEFHIKETGDGLTSSSIVVAWNDTDKSKQFKLWYAIVKDDDSKLVQNKSFENTVQEGRIADLKPATKYKAEFYTTVPDRHSSMSPPHDFYTRPSDVHSVEVKDVHKDNLTVTLKNGAENKDVHFNVLVTSNEGYKNNWNITNGPWSVVVTSLTEATNYSIAVYAVFIKDDGSALLSSDAFCTWTYSGPPAPTKIDILSIHTNSLTIKPSTNINVSATITYDVSYAAILATPLDWVTIYNVSGEIKLNTLSAVTYYTIRVYTKLTQTSRPVTITSGDFLEISTYTSFHYNVTQLSFTIFPEDITTTTALLWWKDGDNYPAFNYFIISVKDGLGIKVNDITVQRRTLKLFEKIVGLRPGNNYTVVVRMYNYLDIPSEESETLQLCTKLPSTTTGVSIKTEPTTSGIRPSKTSHNLGFHYNVTQLSFTIFPEDITTTTALLWWKDGDNYPAFKYFIISVKDGLGIKVNDITVKRRTLKLFEKIVGLRPGNNYTVVVRMYNYLDIPSEESETLQLCTKLPSTTTGVSIETEQTTIGIRPSKTSHNLGLVAGAVAGTVTVLAVVIAVIVIIRKRNCNTKEEPAENSYYNMSNLSGEPTTTVSSNTSPPIDYVNTRMTSGMNSPTTEDEYSKTSDDTENYATLQPTEQENIYSTIN